MATKTFLTAKEVVLRKRSTSHAMRMRNVEKHIRIANATTGHERDVHVAKANKYAKRYEMDKPFK